MLPLLAAMLVSQCATGVTDNAQTLCGVKTLPQGVVVGENAGDYPGAVVRGSGVLLDGPYASIQTTGGRHVYLRDDRAASDPSPSFVLQTRSFKVGEIARFYNGNTLLLTLQADGNLVLHGDGAFTTSGAHSGSPALRPSSGAYLGVSARLPPNYQGEHGALSVSNENPCVGHNLLQAGNGRSGTRTDYAFNVSCRGGIYSRDMINAADLPICDNGLSEPPEPNNRYGGCPNLVTPKACNFGQCGAQVDGGYCHDWTTFWGHDAGHAKAGEVFGFVADVGEGCQCVPAKYDGGVSPAGWFKLSDRSECRV